MGGPYTRRRLLYLILVPGCVDTALDADLRVRRLQRFCNCELSDLHGDIASPASGEGRVA